MRGPDPRIHLLGKRDLRKGMDCIGPRACPRSAYRKRRKSGKPDLRVKPGNDGLTRHRISVTGINPHLQPTQPADRRPIFRSIHGHRHQSRLVHRRRAHTRRFRQDAGRVLQRRLTAGRRGGEGHRGRDREGCCSDRRRRQDRRTRGAARILRPGPPGGDQGRRHRRGLSRAGGECARRGGALARQGAPRGELGQARKGLQQRREGPGHHLQSGQGWLHRRPRRRGGISPR